MGAVLLGEPSGENLNSFGEVKTFTLPNSGIEVQYSTRFFTLAPSGDGGPLQPDVPITPTFQDVAAGKDPVLERALVWEP